MAQATSWVVETLEVVEGTLAEEETSVEEVNDWNVHTECDFCFSISSVSWLEHLTRVFRKTFSSVLCSRRLWGWWWRWWEQRKLWGW